MKRVLILLMASLLIVPTDAGAQSFLKGLKEKAEKKIEKATNSILGKEGSDDEAQSARTEFDAAQKEYQKRVSVRNVQQKDNGSGKRDNSHLKGAVTPSTATSAIDLFNELPPIPKASDVAKNDPDVREAFYTKIYAVKERIEQIQEMGDSEAGLAVLGSNSQTVATAPKQVSAEESAALEKRLAEVFGNGSMEEFQAKAEADNAKIEKIQAEIEKLEKKKNPTAADKKRLEELNAEAMEIASAYSDLFNAASEVTSTTRTEFGQSQSDFEYTEYITKTAELRAAVEMGGDPAISKSKSVISQLKKAYKQLWSEPDADKCAELYVKADEMLANYKSEIAQARLDYYGEHLNKAKELFDQAQKFASQSAEESIYSFSMKQSPYNALELYAIILEKCFDELGELSFEPVYKTRVDIAMEEGDELIPSESRYVFMTKGDLSSIFGAPAQDDTLEEEFISKATIVVYSRPNYVVISGGKRSNMKRDEDFSFLKEAKWTPTPSGKIKMNSMDKVITLSEDGKLTLPDGTSYYPIAMQRTEDWLSFIIEEQISSREIVLTKCMYML